MKLSIQYKNANGSFELEAEDEEGILWLHALAMKTLWNDNAKAYTLEEIDRFLGWNKND